MKNRIMFDHEYQQINSSVRNHTSECYCKHASEKIYAFDGEWQCELTFPKFKGCIYSIPNEQKCSLALAFRP